MLSQRGALFHILHLVIRKEFDQVCLTWEIQTHWPTTKHWKLHILWKYVLLRLFTFQSALLSGGDVIIVIGGDNKYQGEHEEERAVISRWAKRKVFSQFSEEYLDGRKSFIFSWNKQHREIHEQALSHHFDPNKNGRKFEYQPDQRKEKPEAATPPPSRLKEVIPPFRRCFSLSGEQQYESELPLKPESSLPHYEAVTGAREIKEWKTLDSRAEGSNISRKKASTTTANNQGAGSEEIFRPRTGETIG